MSRLFEALQKSEPELSFDFPLAMQLTDELLKAAETESPQKQSEEFETSPRGKQDSALAPELAQQLPSVPLTIKPDARLVCLTQKDSLAAEKFRFLAVRLRQLQQSRAVKKLLVTSTIPEEGKSMISANLALSLARKKRQRILLVEGDLRRPTLYQSFGLRSLPGVSEWLKSGSSEVTNVYRFEEAGLWFFPAGSLPGNPMELLQSARLAELMEQLAVWFDWIVIDSPPILPLADTSVWSRLADGILLVAREGTTRKRELQRGLDTLDHAKLLGMVLNSSDSTDQSNYYQRYGPAQSTAQAKTE
jgi:capsular exopolysaccharide synthesis family protein